MRGLLRPLERRTGPMLKTLAGHLGSRMRGGETLATILLKNLGGSAAAGTAFASERASQ